jgi:hypothetical protein
VSNITLPRADALQIQEALDICRRAAAFRLTIAEHGAALRAGSALDAALAEPDAIARAVEAAVKECVTICERQRVKILKNPADPSWTEHLAEVQSAMKQRFSVEMGYPALAEPEQKPEPATDEQAAAAYDGKRGTRQWVDFRDGWLHAERFHGITKEDKT